ncbi:MAG: amidohydrolase family protein [Dehalococcoidia bacterium]|nr:amidohydrolase family protein [Dehalococcoidia bacterium]
MIIDMHSHIIAPSAFARLKSEPRTYGASYEETENGPRFSFNDTMQMQAGLVTPDTWRSLTEMDLVKAHLPQIGADGAVLSTYISWHRYTLPMEFQLPLCRLINDGLAEWIKGEDAFRGMATLPLQDGAAAAAELRRTTGDGLIGAMLVTNTGDGRSLDADHLEPLWQAAEELDAPIFLHPSNVAGRDRMYGWALENLIGNPLDTTIAAASLILSGVMDRHPRLKVVLSHGGGYFPYGIGRLAHGYANNPATRKTAKQSPEAYLRSFYYDTIVYSPLALKYLIELVGPDRIMLGTDYPFNMEPPDAVRAIEALEVGKEESQRILGNAAELYGFV